MSPIEEFIIKNQSYLEDLNKVYNFKEIFEIVKPKCSPITFGQYLRKYLDYKKYKEQRRKFDAFYFDIIDTEDKAYLLGFIVADGCLYKTNNSLIIAISEKDIEIINRFQNIIGIGSYSLQPKLNPLHQNISRLTYTSEYLLNSLNNLGIPYNKSKEQFGIPNIPEELIPFFINGYFDGDGSVSNWRNKNFEVCFTDSNKLLLSEIQQYLNKNLNIKGSFRQRENYYQYRFAGINNLTKFYKQIYSKGVVLKRKQNKFLDAIPC